ncbi:glycosyltransferase [Aporhodopirellula aestuarii]|uniref:Glycosyltransferase family 2 protein n=1 Tax=Aporhodopirellula aestuarii TaxID=2950107 RepID=A0ABT0U039_9BACT|nr:glycosyltransferase family 2 protein [Aporhodopirellula aestuarii]MCM2370262.1 glycosyltransferase family 2 protein [Aporhodopirellula aestuarii]
MGVYLVTLAEMLFWTVVVIVAIQSSFAVAFSAIMIGRRPPTINVFCPKAVVVLCLRGSDPFLRQCVMCLLGQDYPHYELHVVVDHDQDPSIEILEEFRSDVRLKVSVLENPLETCSLKCSSIVQAVLALESSVEIVALCDADCVPHETWLAELVAPFADERVGATTGNRWYRPPEFWGGAMVRYVWNIPAALNMILLRIGWGGSLAIRRQAIDESGLLEKWSHALCEDTMLYQVLRRHGYRQVFVPSVLMVNRESCTLHDLMQWIPRQMLTAKLYHPLWPLTFGYGVISFIVPLLSVVLAVVGWVRSDPHSMWMALTLFVGFEFSNVVLVTLCELSARRQFRNQETRGGRSELMFWLGLPLWIVIAQMTGPHSFLKCFTAKEISWRGIRYRIRGREIRRETYTPLCETAGDVRSL